MVQASAPTYKADIQLALAKGVSSAQTSLELSREIRRNWKDGEDEEEEGTFSCIRWFPLSFIWKTICKESSNNLHCVGVASNDKCGLPELGYSSSPDDSPPLKRDTPRSPNDFFCKAPGCLEVRKDRDLINRHMEIKHPELHGNYIKTMILSRHNCNYSRCGESYYVLKNLQQHLARHKTVNEIFKTSFPTLQGTPPADVSTNKLSNYPLENPRASMTVSEPLGLGDRTPTLSDATVIPYSSARPTHSLQFLQYTAPEYARELVDADALLPSEVTKVISIEYLHATTKGVRATRVLVVTQLGRARLLRIVSFEALLERKRIAR